MINLKNHPFAVEAFFEKSIVLTFSIPKEEVDNLIPECLTLDTFNDTHAFIAVAMVETKNLRPKGFPKFMGNDFFLIGYRIFVKYKNSKGKIFRGLYILKSETNKFKMKFLGNIFTHYKYTKTDIKEITTKDSTIIQSKKSNFILKYNSESESVKLPRNSPFNTWKEARKFSGPLPFTFTYNKTLKEILIIEGVRQNWKPKPIQILTSDFLFLKTLQIKNMQLANAFIIEKTPYYWKKGKIELWKN